MPVTLFNSHSDGAIMSRPFRFAELTRSKHARPPAFLASVTNEDEARLALHAGAEVIDAKDPQSGALGALAVNTVAAIVDRVAGIKLVSATVGDLPTDAVTMVAAARDMARTGVDIVKIGLFPGGDASEAIVALGKTDLNGARLVAVMLADHDPDVAIVPRLASAGFLGVMLDTADKTRGSLTSIVSTPTLAHFVDVARRHNLIVGLAGSLTQNDIAPIARLRPDIMGFRGALCDGGRTGALDAARTAAIGYAIIETTRTAADLARTLA